MARSRTVVIIDTDLPSQSQLDVLDDAQSRPLEFLQKLMNYARGLKAGARNAKIRFGSVQVSSTTVDAVAANKAGTFSGVPTQGDTVTVNGTAFEARDSGATGNQFNKGASATAAAANLAAAINASATDGVSGVVSASSVGAVITISCLIPGVIGNSITISESGSSFSFAGGATALSAGTGKLPVLKVASVGK